MKIAIQILILSVINLTNEFTPSSISYISLILLCLIYIYAIQKQIHPLYAELLLLSNLLVCLCLFDISDLGCIIMAQKISKHNIVFLIGGINTKFIRVLNYKEIIQGELILIVILGYLLKEELQKISKKKQIQQNHQEQQQVLIEDHSQLISNTTNNLQKDFFKNFINLIPNGLLILNDEDTVIASNQQLSLLFPDKTPQVILNLLQDGKNLNQEIDVEDEEFRYNLNNNQGTFSDILVYSNKEYVKSEIQTYFNQQINQDQLSQFRITRSSQMYVKLKADMINNTLSAKSTIITKLPDTFYNMYLIIIFIQFIEEGQSKLMIFLKDESSSTRIQMLKKLNHNKSKMLRNVCHELRNPVSAISMIAKGMEQSLDPHIYQEYGEPIQLTTILVMNLLNDLLDVAQMNSGNFSLSLSQFNLKSLLEEIKRLMQFQLKSQSVDLILNCNVQQIITDQNRLRQVIINLISNALKFTPQGRIAINVQRQTNEIVDISVVDTGKGIVKEDQKKLFKVFSKLKSTVSLNKNGVGLGLNISQALCKKLCKIKGQNNGLQVYSEGENKGTTFSFSIQDHYTTTTQAQSSQKKKSIYTQDSLRFSNCNCFEILIVDDQQFILHAAKIALSNQYLKIDTASSGMEAYEKVMTYQAFEDCGCRNYKIIFMDIEMPGMDGLTTTSKIRADFPNERICIIGCSGYSQLGQQQSKEQGLYGFIQKPITIEKISSIIREIKEE